jgi:hypothetical protein
VGVSQGRFNGALGNLELLGWIIAISGTLQKPTQIHGAYELVHEVPISVATPARDQCKVICQGLFVRRRSIHRQQQRLCQRFMGSAAARFGSSEGH